MKKLVISIFCVSGLILSSQVHAQQIPLYSNYFFTPYIYNPAQSGTAGVTEANLLHRRQWSGVQGAPQTTAVTLNGNIGSDNVGYSVYGFNDEIGVIQKYGFYGAYAYHLQLSESNFLSFGLAGGYMNHGINFNAVRSPDMMDPVLVGELAGRSTLDISAGVNLRVGGFQVGASVPQLLNSPVNFLNQADNEAYFRTFRHFLFNAQYDFSLQTDRIVLSPLVMVRAAENIPLMVDAGAMVNFAKIGYLGAMYRSDYAVTGNIGFHINDNLSVGYAYDFSTNQYAANLGTSHEILMTWRFGSNNRVDRLENEVKRMRQMDRQRRDDMEELIDEKLDEALDELRRTAEREAEERRESEGDARQGSGQGDGRGTTDRQSQQQQADRQRQSQQQDQQRQQQQQQGQSYDELTKRSASNVVPGSKGYYVVAGVFGSKENADKLQGRLQRSGFDVAQFRDPANNMVYVYLYKFDTYDEANRIKESNINGRYNGSLWIKIMN